MPSVASKNDLLVISAKVGDVIISPRRTGVFVCVVDGCDFIMYDGSGRRYFRFQEVVHILRSYPASWIY